MATNQSVRSATRALRALLKHADAASVTLSGVAIRGGALVVEVNAGSDFTRLQDQLGRHGRYFRTIEAWWFDQPSGRECCDYRHAAGTIVTLQGPPR